MNEIILTPFYTKLFLSHVDIGAPDECWEWKLHRGSDGYGHVRYNSIEQYAHRVSWTIANGPIPEGMYVCHKCDNPPCCNPNHLFLGTQADNMRDAIEKGRTASRVGELNTNSKLTAPDIKRIRILLEDGSLSHRQIGALFGVVPRTISHISTGAHWSHIR